MAKLAIIKTGSTLAEIRAKRGDFEDWIIEQSAVSAGEWDVFSIFQRAELPDLRRYKAAIITGSHSMVTEKAEWMEKTSQWLKGLFSNLPVLGICFGHQLIAQTFGGRVELNPVKLETGMTCIQLTEDGINDNLFKDLPAAFSMPSAHSQSVTRLPEGAKLLAKNQIETNLAFRLGSNIWGVQFHPEFDEDILTQYVNAEHPAKRTLSPIFRGPKNKNSSGAKILQNFISIVEG
jgi:GMP synthase (glutamine-hydrolysing)